ncbi:MAG: sterol carrier protein [Solirubrobacteraceae bacterium]
MSVFATEQDVYDQIGRLLEAMVDDERLVWQFQRADTVVQYRYHDPDAVITVDVRRDSEPSVVLGECDLEPEVIMSMAADTAHRFFLGDVNVTIALARREIVADGPVAKILKLVPLVKPFFPYYRAQLGASGRTELVTA